MAAALAADAVLSHRSAAALWGIRESSSGRIEVTAPRERRRPGVTVHRAVLPRDEITVHDGIPVTTAARTLLDLAALLDEHKLARAAERAEALRLTSPTSLSDLVDRYPRRKGTKNLNGSPNNTASCRRPPGAGSNAASSPSSMPTNCRGRSSTSTWTR
jgi:predicted transcriptional regulator of viral defense system